MKIWRKRIGDSINQLISDEAVYRTAPATPGLLKSIQIYTLRSSRHIINLTKYIEDKPNIFC